MSDAPTVLAVDRNRRNLELLTQFLAKEGYRAMAVNSLEELDQVLNEPKEVGLALVDISGFDRRIWEHCERLREMGIPFLLISSRQSSALQQTSLDYGAHGVLVKPLAVKELLVLIQNLLKEYKPK